MYFKTQVLFLGITGAQLKILSLSDLHSHWHPSHIAYNELTLYMQTVVKMKPIRFYP